MKRASLTLFLLCAAACIGAAEENPKPTSVQVSSAQSAAVVPPSDQSWQAIRRKQPAGLQMSLSLPKTRYHLGERIPATLIFANEPKDPYYTWIGTYDRSGRISDIVFHAEDEHGAPVDDPLDYYLHHFGLMGGGLGNNQDLGLWKITLAANQWLRFEKPGTYKLYATSSRVRPGHKDDRRDVAPPSIDLVSDPIEITIDPLSAEEEKAIIAEATRVLAASHSRGWDEAAFSAVQQLRFLQTPAANEALLPLIDTPWGHEAMLAFYSSKDYAATAAGILAAVEQGKLGLGLNLVSLYNGLKTGSNFVLTIGDAKAAPPAPQEMLYAAAKHRLQTSAQDDISFADLLTLFRTTPQDTEVRALLIRRQRELPQKQIDEILREKEKSPIADKEFLPLLRDLVTPEKHNPNALAALVAIAPEEARPIVMAEIARPKTNFLPTDHVFRADMDLFALTALPDKEIPELDPLLRQKLRDAEDDTSSDILESTLVLTERYGTKALLPDVKKIYLRHEGHWACTLQSEMLRYWIRCDRAEGLAMLARALTKNAAPDTGCYHSTLADVLQNAWVDEALPVVMEATTHQDLQVVRSAARVLDAHAGPEAIDPLITAIERVSARPLPNNPSNRDEQLYVPRELTQYLLHNKRWTLTRPQIERLQKVILDKSQQTELQTLLSGAQ